MAEPLLQCSYMPGDSFAIAAYLALTKDARVVYLRDDSLNDNKHSFITGLYGDTGVLGQVTVIDVRAIWSKGNRLTTSPLKEVYRLWSDDRVPARPQDFTDPNATRQEVIREILTAIFAAFRQWPRAVTAVTGWLARSVERSRDHRLAELLKKWQIATLTKGWAKDFDDFLSAKGLTKLAGKSLVMWSRQSGKRGGAHLELDSSYAGIRQIAKAFNEASDGDYSLILAGDDKDKGTTTKLQQIAEDYGGCHLGEFWKTIEWKSKFDENRVAQLAFWIYLNGTKSSLVHLGMRSGNLEVMGILGMPAVYLETVGSLSGKRMTAFEKAGIPYERIQIVEAPGLTGHWAEDFEKAQKLPAKLHDFQRDVGSEAKAIAKRKIDAVWDDINRLKGLQKTARRNKQWSKVDSLQDEIDDLFDEKDGIYNTDYTRSAKANVKEWDPASGKYSRQRGFYDKDIDTIVNYVLKRLNDVP
jgi:hypothetical protein